MSDTRIRSLEASNETLRRGLIDATAAIPRAFRNGFLLGCVVAGAVGILGAMV